MILDQTGESRSSIRIKGVTHFSWCPFRNMFYFTFTEGEGTHPQYGFINIPSRI